MRTTASLLFSLASMALPAAACSLHQQPLANSVTPAAEQRPASGDAPSSTAKVTVQPLGSVDLAQEFAGLEGRVLRTRRITIAPGGSVAWHEHQRRPGVAYILSGNLIEVRQDGTGQRRIQRQAGDAVFESSGVRHGWMNNSAQPATAVVIDLVPASQP
ncbi:MAG: hypothetical protein CMN97_07385 [Synechococcus sp. NAT40]|jgi:quercetin dioxygenase-like cupin family protein|nr:hypothetical protein [Synechococcus sp. NAT40]